MENIAVERSIWIDAPRERVWQAVTDPAQVVQWFLPVPMGGMQMKRDDSGKLSLSMGEMDMDFAILEVMDQPRKVTSRSLPDRLLATTYTFEEENQGTRLTVTMTGFEVLPESARHDRLNLSGAAWGETLENLKAYIAGAERPFPYSAVAPLFGFWREAEKVAVERTVWIKATRERVWSAITDPQQIEQWFAPGTTFKVSGEGVGSRLYVENPETGGEMYVQTLEVVEPPHRLVTRSVPEPSEMPYVTTWTLDEENGGTRLTLTYTGYELEPDDVRHQKMEENTFGFGLMMANIKAVIEGTSLPQPQGF